MHPSLRNFFSIIQQLNPFRAGYPSRLSRNPEQNSQVGREDASNSSSSIPHNEQKDSEIWAQLMTRIAIQRMEDTQDPNLRTILFVHSKEQCPPYVECWITSPQNIACRDLNIDQMIGAFAEKNWDQCWPVLVRELEKIVKSINRKNSNRCCALISTPQHPSNRAPPSLAKNIVALRIVFLSESEATPPAPRLRAVGTNERPYLWLVKK
jgi:hypothetical protein